MAEKTNNSKVITKDYLAEQFYIYHKKYIKEGIEENKQDKLIVDTKHLTWNSPNLGLKIDNDSSAEVNDYISLKNSDGTLTWKTPITVQEQLNNSTNLVTGKAVYDFKGSENIVTVGNISAGAWSVGNIKINDTSISISDFTIKQEEAGDLSILSKDQNKHGLIADSLSLNKNLTVTGDISAENININTKLDAKETTIEEASIYDLIIGNTISASNENDFIIFGNKISVSGDIKLDGDINFTKITDFSIKSGNTKHLTINQNNISLNKDVIVSNSRTTTKSLTIEDSEFTLGSEELTIITEEETDGFFDDWQS